MNPLEPDSLHARRLPRPDALAGFRNRVAKGFRHWSRWARRQDFGAFRCYDRDLPEFPVAIDCYVPADPSLGMRLHLQEIDTAWVQEPQEHAAWLAAVCNASVEATGVVAQDVVVKQRPRRSGGRQHETTGAAGREFPVRECGHLFRVNLEAYLDTGLFPDHRRMRAMVGARAAGRRMLNLFAYTGSFTVYAAAGGATASDSVDLSNTYLDWARRNFTANGLDLDRHRLVRSDVLRWLPQAAAAGERYDLIVLDPPAFSHSKAMTEVLDVQRDHARLIRQCLDLLAPGGELFFSTNLRSFRLDATVAALSSCRDIGRQTRAEDYRDPRVHHAFLFGGT